MANTFELIASSTVGSGGTSAITFSSIASTWTDLCLKFSVRNTTNPYAQTAIWYKIGFNGQGANVNVSGKMVFGDGTSASSLNNPTDFDAAGYMPSSGATASTFNNAELYIPNYAGSTNKSFALDSVSETNGSFSVASFFAGLWSQTAAITSITFTSRNGNFAEFSTAYLYGVKNA